MYNEIKFLTEGDPDKWESTCLPIGNGYMGATFFGGIERETVVLNEKTLWIGGPSPSRPGYNGGNRKGAYKSVKRVQELLAAGKYDEALELLPDLTCETGDGFGAYQCLCNAVFEFPGTDKSKAADYERKLDLDKSLYSCKFTQDGVIYRREAFASYPARAIIMRFCADKAGSVSFKLSLDKLQDGGRAEASENRLDYYGALADNGLRYHASFRITNNGGEVTCANGTITVVNADEALICFTAATDYSDIYPAYRSGTDPLDTVKAVLGNIGSADFDKLYGEHFADYNALYGRTKLSLNGVSGEVPDIETLLKRYKDGDSTAADILEPLYFQYGRYLLISSSREGSLPANLQGVWNESNTPPWCCDYHINVNLQMNYWGSFNTNIAETAGPLVNYLDSLRAPGRVTAKEYYNIATDDENPENGWIAHTQSTPFGWTSPGWDFYWGWSTAAVAWLMLNIYDYYDFTRDEKLLRERIYPIMRETARFYTQWLIWDEKQQRLVSSPTYSPEHGPVTIGNTYEQSLILEFYERFYGLCVYFPEDRELFEKVEEQKELLKPFSVSNTGLLKEWFEEDKPYFDRSKIQQNHRHISHLMSLYPGRLINRSTPELMQAATATMNDRGDESTGWARAYKVNLWARTSDGDRAYKLLHGLLTDCTFPNLWDFHPPFQIDGNFGGSAGIAEMLLQSHELIDEFNVIDILPAIPAKWSDGEFEGLCARGGYEVSAKWNGRKASEISITAGAGCETAVYVRTELTTVTGSDGSKESAESKNGCLSFETKPGMTYIISR
ncbi:MAG: glycoside hydrolase family 95 protein [Ruminiclostridium sp.]|nr:glycoside hydrolase family 95 protein [Ruminiclostridium sp.]